MPVLEDGGLGLGRGPAGEEQERRVRRLVHGLPGRLAGLRRHCRRGCDGHAGAHLRQPSVGGDHLAPARRQVAGEGRLGHHHRRLGAGHQRQEPVRRQAVVERHERHVRPGGGEEGGGEGVPALPHVDRRTTSAAEGAAAGGGLPVQVGEGGAVAPRAERLALAEARGGHVEDREEVHAERPPWSSRPRRRSAARRVPTRTRIMAGAASPPQQQSRGRAAAGAHHGRPRPGSRVVVSRSARWRPGGRRARAVDCRA